MKVNLHTPVEEVQIQIVPLIDVVFCILTFFILAALQFTRQQAINVDLPKAKTGTASQPTAQQAGRDILPVTIDAVGQTFVEKEPINREQLAQKLRDYLQKNPNGTLVLNASRTATYNDVIQTLDLLRQVGGDRVALGIIPGANEPTNSLPPVSPNFGINPNAPGVPINPPGSPNLNLPGAGNQVPFPVAPQAPVNPGVYPVAPNQQAPSIPPSQKTNPAPQR